MFESIENEGRVNFEIWIKEKMWTFVSRSQLSLFLSIFFPLIKTDHKIQQNHLNPIQGMGWMSLTLIWILGFYQVFSLCHFYNFYILYVLIWQLYLYYIVFVSVVKLLLFSLLCKPCCCVHFFFEVKYSKFWLKF